MRGAEVCGGPWQGLECLSGRRNVVLAVGWALAIPISGLGGWLGSTPPRYPPTHTHPWYTLPLTSRCLAWCTRRWSRLKQPL